MAQSLTLEQIQPKLRIVKPKSADQDAPVTKAYPAPRVTALEDGLQLNRQDGGVIKYADISMLLVFRLDIDPDTWYIDVFVYGQPAPFRISQKAVIYRQFLTDISQRSKDNFFQFCYYLIEQTDSVYVDDNTLEFLKSKKVIGFPDFSLFENYTRQLWFQVVSWMKFQCDNCGEVYWVDDAKVNPQGAKTKCVKCQHIVTVQKRERPVVLQEKAKQVTIPCPHCQYENIEGAQFCVMCQKPLVDFAEKAKAKADAKRPPKKQATSEEEPPPLPETEVPHASQEMLFPPDLADVPLQARMRRMPNLSLREVDHSLLDDIKTLDNPFSWYSTFAFVMRVFGFLALAGGLLAAGYIYFVIPPPTTADMMTDAERARYTIASVTIGSLASLICFIVSNIIALNLAIERNTKVTSLLLQRLISKLE